MILKFDNEHFQEFAYPKSTVSKYLKSAYKDLNIAKNSRQVDVIFQFSYNAFIKLGIALIAVHGYKVRSRSGHHIKIIDKAAKILNNTDISAFGNSMRKTRNMELYDGGASVSEKQAKAYFEFVNKTFLQSEKVFKEYFSALL